MSRSAAPTLPKYRHYRPKNLAVVRLSGGDFYLGTFGTPKSREKYDRLIAEWLAAGRDVGIVADSSLSTTAATPLSINELLLAYWRHAEQHYSKELVCMKHAIRPPSSARSTLPRPLMSPIAFR